jgi:hypothetical protein
MDPKVKCKECGVFGGLHKMDCSRPEAKQVNFPPRKQRGQETTFGQLAGNGPVIRYDPYSFEPPDGEV